MTQQGGADRMSTTRWYLGSLNDGLFITDTPPSPSGTDIPPDWGPGLGMVLNVVSLSQEQAQAIVDAHNAADDTGLPRDGR